MKLTSAAASNTHWNRCARVPRHSADPAATYDVTGPTPRRRFGGQMSPMSCEICVILHCLKQFRASNVGRSLKHTRKLLRSCLPSLRRPRCNVRRHGSGSTAMVEGQMSTTSCEICVSRNNIVHLTSAAPSNTHGKRCARVPRHSTDAAATFGSTGTSPRRRSRVKCQRRCAKFV